MSKRIIAVITVAAFLASSAGCFHAKKSVKAGPDALAGARPYATTIVAVQKKSGELLSFGPGRQATTQRDMLLVPDQPQGSARSFPERIPAAEIRDIEIDAKGRVTEVLTNDGRLFRIEEGEKDEQGVRILKAVAYRVIPLSDIALVWYKKTDRTASFAMTCVTVAAAAAIVALIAGSGHRDPSPPPDESCPFVYSFDGKEYVLDAEPYGGSVCRGLERTDWIGLDSLRPADGRYKLMLSNELAEVEHVNELKVVVVDHPAAVEVFPELSGRMRTAASPVPPLSARDADGGDVRPLLEAKDGAFWLGRTEGRDPDSAVDLKEDLVLEFAKPAGVRQAKLVATAWTTRWGSQAIRPLLESQGRELGAFFDRVNAGGPALLSLLSWFGREEMYQLQVRVETAAGWKTKALLNGGGPFIAKDRVYQLDLSDVPGETVRIRLTPAVGFWMIDRLALDFSEDRDVWVNELTAVSAHDASGKDIAADLAATDGAYYTIPKGSQPAMLEFAAPPETPGLVRSAFIKARGYYDILLDAQGEPTLDLRRTIDTPGESLRYVLRTHPALSRPQ